jgi:fumarate reductase subunit D
MIRITRHAEPLLWMLFSAGGVVSGMLLPVLVLLFGIAFPLAWIEPPSRGGLLGLLAHPLARLSLWSVVVLSLFHWAHRFRHTLYDGLQIKHLDEVIAIASYGVAIAGSAWAAYLLWRVP